MYGYSCKYVYDVGSGIERANSVRNTHAFVQLFSSKYAGQVIDVRKLKNCHFVSLSVKRQ